MFKKLFYFLLKSIIHFSFCLFVFSLTWPIVYWIDYSVKLPIQWNCSFSKKTIPISSCKPMIVEVKTFYFYYCYYYYNYFIIIIITIIIIMTIIIILKNHIFIIILFLLLSVYLLFLNIDIVLTPCWAEQYTWYISVHFMYSAVQYKYRQNTKWMIPF